VRVSKPEPTVVYQETEKGMIEQMDFVKPYLFGLTLAFTIGPMSLLIVQRGITKGIRSALITSLGLAVADFTHALISFSIGASILTLIQGHTTAIQLFSGIILLGLSLHIAFSSFKNYQQKLTVTAVKSSGSDFLSAYLLTLHNPMTILLFLGFLGYISASVSVMNTFVSAFSLFLGSLTGQVFIGCTATSLRRFFQHPKAILTLNTLSALVIALFAVGSFVKAFA